jgi:hypothetical protein
MRRHRAVAVAGNRSGPGACALTLHQSLITDLYGNKRAASATRIPLAATDPGVSREGRSGLGPITSELGPN